MARVISEISKHGEFRQTRTNACSLTSNQQLTEVWSDQAQRQPFEFYCEGFGVVFDTNINLEWDLSGISFLLYGPSSA